MNTLAYEIVALAMVVGGLAGLILAFCVVHHAIFTAVDRYRDSQSTSGDPLMCQYCGTLCIPDGYQMCDCCADVVSELHAAEVRRLIEGTQP